jgi:hypothetical protein
MQFNIEEILNYHIALNEDANMHIFMQLRNYLNDEMNEVCEKTRLWWNSYFRRNTEWCNTNETCSNETNVDLNVIKCTRIRRNDWFRYINDLLALFYNVAMILKESIHRLNFCFFLTQIRIDRKICRE